jgi:hypothetical protein
MTSDNSLKAERRRKNFGATLYNDCQKFFPILEIHKSPLPPCNKLGNYKELLIKTPFEKGGFRGI